MWNLIKMDFYRLCTSRALKIGAIVTGILAAVCMLFSLGVVAIVKISFTEDPELAVQMGALLSQTAWVVGVDLAEVALCGTTTFALFVGCMLTANFIGSEMSCGYTKNFAGQLPNRGYMAISKFLVTSFAHIIVLVIYTAVAGLLGNLLLSQYITGLAWSSLFATLGLRILLHIALNSIIVFVCMFTKSHAVAMVVGCIFGIGMTKLVYLGASMLLSAIKINFDISKYMPDGINLQLEAGNFNTLIVRAIIVSIAFIAVFVTTNYFVLQKRDVK